MRPTDCPGGLDALMAVDRRVAPNQNRNELPVPVDITFAVNNRLAELRLFIIFAIFIKR